LRPERKDDRLFVRRGLQLESETHAELLAQRETPRAIDLRAERRVDDELHPAALVEEALEDDALLGRYASQHLTPRDDVVRDLHRGALGQRIAARRPERGRAIAVRVRALFAERPDLLSELAGPPGPFSQPEGQAGRLAFRVGDPDGARLQAEDPPRRIA